MRLFIASEFPEIKEYLKDIQKSLEHVEGIRITDSFHITYKFLGEISENLLKPIYEMLEKVKLSPIECSLDSPGVFPDIKKPRVIWVGLSPIGPIKELHDMIEDSLSGMFAKDTRFHPHITLGRVKFIKDIKMLKELIGGMKIERKNIKIKSFSLIKSTLTKHGPSYETVKEFRLY